MRNFLEALSVEELCQVGRDLGIDVFSLIKKNELVEFILENIETDEESNNLLIRGEGLKYSAGKSRKDETFDSIDYPIPEMYDETRIVLMLRDPDWAFAYWDLNTSVIEQLKTDKDFESLLLRVYDFDDKSFYFDITVQFSDMSWYINLPNRNCSYIIELGYMSNGNYTSLAESNKIHTPEGNFAVETDPDWYSENTDKLIEYSKAGLSLLEKGEDIISQRIISFSGSSYIQRKE